MILYLSLFLIFISQGLLAHDNCDHIEDCKAFNECLSKDKVTLEQRKRFLLKCRPLSTPLMLYGLRNEHVSQAHEGNTKKDKEKESG